jgi:hypothetical protein
VLLMNDRTQKAAKTLRAASDGVPPRCRSYYPYQHLTDPLYFLWHLCVRLAGTWQQGQPPAQWAAAKGAEVSLLSPDRGRKPPLVALITVHTTTSISFR